MVEAVAPSETSGGGGIPLRVRALVLAALVAALAGAGAAGATAGWLNRLSDTPEAAPASLATLNRIMGWWFVAELATAGLASFASMRGVRRAGRVAVGLHLAALLLLLVGPLALVIVPLLPAVAGGFFGVALLRCVWAGLQARTEPAGLRRGAWLAAVGFVLSAHGLLVAVRRVDVGWAIGLD